MRRMRGYAQSQGRDLDEGRLAVAMRWKEPERDVAAATTIAVKMLGFGKLVCCV